jgi:hypothetical protein
MRAEHCSKAGFNHAFTTPNYGFTTTAEQEWMIVVEGAACPPENLRHGRVIKPLEELVQLGREQAGLCREEVIATTDYTGPMVSPKHRARSF